MKNVYWEYRVFFFIFLLSRFSNYLWGFRAKLFLLKIFIDFPLAVDNFSISLTAIYQTSLNNVHGQFSGTKSIFSRVLIFECLLLFSFSVHIIIYYLLSLFFSFYYFLCGISGKNFKNVNIFKEKIGRDRIYL